MDRISKFSTIVLAMCVASIVVAFHWQTTLSGTVRVAGAASPTDPVGSANVQVLQGNSVAHSGKSDSSGTYSVTGLEPGSYTVEFSKANFVRTQVANVLIADGTPKTQDGLLIPSLKLADATPPGATSRTWNVKNSHNFPVIFSWRITGTNHSGAGVAQPGDNLLNTPQIFQGQFIQLLVQGVVVRKKGGKGEDVTPVTGSVSGFVVDSTALTVDGASVCLFDGLNTDPLACVQSDGTGAYALHNINPGDYYIVATKQGYETYTSSFLPVTSGTVTVQNATLVRLAFGILQITLADPTNGSAVIIYSDSPENPVALDCDPFSGECPFQDQRVGVPLTIEVTNGQGQSSTCNFNGFTAGDNGVITCG